MLYHGLSVLGGGATLAGVILGSIAVCIIDRTLERAAIFALVGTVLTFFGFIHGEAIGIGRTPVVALSYLGVAAILYACAKYATTSPAVVRGGGDARHGTRRLGWQGRAGTVAKRRWQSNTHCCSRSFPLASLREPTPPTSHGGKPAPCRSISRRPTSRIRPRLRQEVRPEHIAFLDAQCHLLLAAGAKLSDDGTTALGSVYIVDTEDRAAAEAFINADPFARHGLFASVVMTRWRKAYFNFASQMA